MIRLSGQKRARGAWLLLILAFVTMAAMACGSSDEGAPDGELEIKPTTVSDDVAANDDSGSGGTLRIGMSAGNIPIPNTPATEGGEGSRFVGTQVYDALINWNLTENTDKSALPGPGLAESWEVGTDQLTWTFNLRAGVTFHDGTPWDADAAIFQFDRLMNERFEYYDGTLRAGNAQALAMLSGYKKVDEMTIQLVTKIPNSFLFWALPNLLFPSPAAVMEYGNKDYAQHAVGTGPFKIERYVDGQIMELIPNEDYWGGAPKLDKLILYPMPEPATRLAALQSAEIDWAEVPPPDSYETLKAAGFNIQLKPYPHVITYQLNIAKAPFDDVKVRQALNYAVDREGTCEGLLNGLCLPASQYVPPGNPWFDESYEGYSYDPEKAKALLAEAGYPDGFKMTVAYPPGGSGNMWPVPMNEKLQQDMAAIGVEMELVPVEWNNIIAGYRAGFANPDWSKYDAIHISLGATQPIALLNYSTVTIPPAGCCNTTGFSDSEIDAMFVKSQEEFDLDLQAELLAEAQSRVTEQAPYIITVHDLNFRVLSPKVRGFEMAQSWVQNLKTVWVAD
ncbi:MAG: ABC transporter substrate-binding protein [Tepidiformaceae bacterium]